MATDTWIDELRAGRASEAIDQLKQALQSERMRPSNFISLGAVYMWAGDFQSALAHFQQEIQTPPRHRSTGDLAFGMAGSAAWCLGDSKLALQYWRKGTEAAYALGGANTRTALLLYVASVLAPDVFSMSEAKEVLGEKANQEHVKRWPGPIAEFILGIRSEKDVREKDVYKSTDIDSKQNDKNPRSWQLNFYKLLTLAASGETTLGGLQNELQTLTNVSGSEYLEGEKFFYFLRLEEFYLAKHLVAPASRRQ